MPCFLAPFLQILPQLVTKCSTSGPICTQQAGQNGQYYNSGFTKSRFPAPFLQILPQLVTKCPTSGPICMQQAGQNGQCYNTGFSMPCFLAPFLSGTVPPNSAITGYIVPHLRPHLHAASRSKWTLECSTLNSQPTLYVLLSSTLPPNSAITGYIVPHLRPHLHAECRQNWTILQ